MLQMYITNSIWLAKVRREDVACKLGINGTLDCYVDMTWRKWPQEKVSRKYGTLFNVALLYIISAYHWLCIVSLNQQLRFDTKVYKWSVYIFAHYWVWCVLSPFIMTGWCFVVIWWGGIFRVKCLVSLLWP